MLWFCSVFDWVVIVCMAVKHGVSVGVKPRPFPSTLNFNHTLIGVIHVQLQPLDVIVTQRAAQPVQLGCHFRVAKSLHLCFLQGCSGRYRERHLYPRSFQTAFCKQFRWMDLQKFFIPFHKSLIDEFGKFFQTLKNDKKM